GEGPRLGVMLHRVLVEVLALVGEVETEHLALGAKAGELAFDLDAPGVATEADRKRFEARVTADVGTLLVQVHDVTAPVLQAYVAELGAILEDDLGGRVVEEAVVERLAGVLVD